MISFAAVLDATRMCKRIEFLPGIGAKKLPGARSVEVNLGNQLQSRTQNEVSGMLDITTTVTKASHPNVPISYMGRLLASPRAR